MLCRSKNKDSVDVMYQSYIPIIETSIHQRKRNGTHSC